MTHGPIEIKFTTKQQNEPRNLLFAHSFKKTLNFQAITSKSKTVTLEDFQIQQASTKFHQFIINPVFVFNLQFIITQLVSTQLSMLQMLYVICCLNKVGAEWMQTYSIQMLHLFLAVEAQLMACSAVIKEIKIQTSFTKTHSSGFSTKISTHSHNSLYNTA